jgi:hypothetical protein
MGIICFADAKKKKQIRENLPLFFANVSTAANCCARYYDLLTVEEKKKNHMVGIK